MAYTVPTLETFRARFPIFSDKDDTMIELIIAEAAGKVDQSWLERDYAPAILYLAAHMVATDNSGEGEAVEVGDTGSISSESFGGMSIAYSRSVQVTTNELHAEYNRTSYGRRYLALLRANFPPVVSI